MNGTVEEILKHLQKFYGKALNPTALANYADKLDRYDEDTLCLCIQNVTDKEVMFPTPFVIGKYYSEAIEAKHNSAKLNAPVFQAVEKAQARTEQGKDTLRLTSLLDAGKLTRDQYLAGMNAMERKYPGVGWMQCARDLKKFWDDEPSRRSIAKAVLEGIEERHNRGGLSDE